MPHNVDVKVSTELNEELLDQKLIAGDLLRCGSCPVVVSFGEQRMTKGGTVSCQFWQRGGFKLGEAL